MPPHPCTLVTNRPDSNDFFEISRHIPSKSMNGSGVLILGSKSSESTVFKTPREHISLNTRTPGWQNRRPNTESSDTMHYSLDKNSGPISSKLFLTAIQWCATCYQVAKQQFYFASNTPLTNATFAARESLNRSNEYVRACNKHKMQTLLKR
jgi:hypothetical protein